MRRPYRSLPWGGGLYIKMPHKSVKVKFRGAKVCNMLICMELSRMLGGGGQKRRRRRVEEAGRRIEEGVEGGGRDIEDDRRKKCEIF